jgi:hypothetical protein
MMHDRCQEATLGHCCGDQLAAPTRGGVGAWGEAWAALDGLTFFAHGSAIRAGAW